MQAIAGTAAVILEAANVRVLVVIRFSEAERVCALLQGARFNRSECIRVAQLVEATLEVLQTELPAGDELPVEVVGALETLHE